MLNTTTPGRAIDHLDRGTLRLDEVAVAVLDEADEMLDMGFQEDLETLLSATPKERQTALFSATFPKRLQRVASAHLTDPERVEVARMPTSDDAPAVREVAVIVRRDDKAEALSRILDLEAPEAALIFCRTRETVDRLADTLASRGYRVEALHGGFSQQLRERVLGRLRAGANDLVIATDVAARGIDVAHLTHVFNFDLPYEPTNRGPFYGAARRHDFHHTHNAGCYADFLPFWDWLCGTDRHFAAFWPPTRP